VQFSFAQASISALAAVSFVLPRVCAACASFLHRFGIGRLAGGQVDVAEHVGIGTERCCDGPEGVADLLRYLVGEVLVGRRGRSLA
jgi:hypothetical protein